MNSLQKVIFRTLGYLSSGVDIDVKVETAHGLSGLEEDIEIFFSEMKTPEHNQPIKGIMAIRHTDNSGPHDVGTGAHVALEYLSDQEFSILAKKELDKPIMGVLLGYLGFEYVDRKGKREGKKKSIDRLIDRADGKFIIIVPNGSRVPEKQRVYLSLAKMAALYQLPVYPVGIKYEPEGTEGTPLSFSNRPRYATFFWGKPIQPPLAYVSDDRKEQYKFVQQILLKTYELTGETAPYRITRSFEETAKTLKKIH
jgi:1-acyl-sn-glycerol-3-phosphate acyltransferase